MKTETSKRRDGFEGEKLISIPPKTWKVYVKKYPNLFSVYITHIGYFPNASFHYRERRKGCADNILIYCLKGKGFYVVGDQRFEVKANEYFLLPATTRFIKYGADEKDPWTIYWIHYTGSILPGLNHDLKVLLPAGPVQIPFNQKFIDLWQEAYQSLERGYTLENLCNTSFLLHYAVASFLFPDTQRNDTGKNDLIEQTISFMKRHFDKQFEVADFSRQHGISSSYFSFIFRKAMGMPPIEYFTHLKMQKASQLLYTESITVREAASRLGYDDPYYFSRAFKRYMGSSPAKYRKLMNKL